MNSITLFISGSRDDELSLLCTKLQLVRVFTKNLWVIRVLLFYCFILIEKNTETILS